MLSHTPATDAQFSATGWKRRKYIVLPSSQHKRSDVTDSVPQSARRSTTLASSSLIFILTIEYAINKRQESQGDRK